MCSTAPSCVDASHAANIHVSDRTIDSHVRNIRAKLAGGRLRRRDRDRARRRLQARPLRRVSMSAAPDKWRPRIGLVVLAILLTVMALPLVGLFFFRIYENQLVRQTEAELIGQGAALAAIYAREVHSAARQRPDSSAPSCRPNVLPDPGDQVTPIGPPRPRRQRSLAAAAGCASRAAAGAASLCRRSAHD